MAEYSDIFKQLKFKWPWREYQSRVLDAIDQHLEDDKLHIVAAPGAGKTVLGLEVFRQLEKPALVLSPTRIIRNQWRDRLQDFLPESQWPVDWVSLELDAPLLLTSVTYQSLHQKYKQSVALSEAEEEHNTEEELDDKYMSALSGEDTNWLVDKIATAGIEVLILDEAHHLTSQWWKVLDHVLDKLPALKLVSLTATPPYEVNGNEWLRYQSLCGTIDEEISSPELVKTGTLSPHQDFIWVTLPAQKDDETTRQYDQSVNAVHMRLYNDDYFIQQIIAHPLMNDNVLNVDAILAQPELSIAMLVLLKAKHIELPTGILKLLGVQKTTIPELSRRWWQVLVKSYLFDKHWSDHDEQRQHKKQLIKYLRKQSLLHNRELRLHESRLIKSQLTLSATKLQACVDIHQHERVLRGQSLRQVILADYIRADDINETIITENVLGAWPVYRRLVASLGLEQAMDCCLITGQFSVMHASKLQLIMQSKYADNIQSTPLKSLDGYCQVKMQSNHAVEEITRLFMQGEFHVLVGTRSLLGEGWDAPCINSLVLASFVGSYVLTNQMRGRAIRIDKNDSEKVSSIWHLVCITNSSYSGIADLTELMRRFKTFVGLSSDGRAIENGLSRISLPFMSKELFDSESFSPSRSNRLMLKSLQQLNQIKINWQRAVDGSKSHRVVPVVRSPKIKEFRQYHFKQTLGYFVLEAVTGALAVSANFAPNIFTSMIHEDEVLVLKWVAVTCAAGFIWFLPKAVKALKLMIKHLPVSGSLQQIANALRDALVDVDELEKNKTSVQLVKNHDGSFDLSLQGASFYQQSLFADCLDEILMEINNPRYLITRRQTMVFGKRVDYHAVPALFASQKKKAQLFYQAWIRYMGTAELIYTRVKDGRIVLLRARARAFSTAIKKKAERLDSWQ